MTTIDIRPLTTLSELHALESLQQTVWGIPDLETLPAHHYHALVENGNSVIGAYDGSRLVGFVFSVLGTLAAPERRDQVAAARLKLYSVMMGVHPDYRDSGIGYRLKLAQRDFASHIGVRLITWTFDPLQSRNARLNIAKLGAVCQTYHRHFHGELGGINAGIPSDRFDVSWWLTSNRVENRTMRQRRPLSLAALVGGGAVLVNPAVLKENGRFSPTSHIPNRMQGTMVLVEIPADYTALKRDDPETAREWRLHTRAIFESLFARGYLVTDFVYEADENGRFRSYYLLTMGTEN